jgi:prepilin-type N-terminal cleavage/methylation domain-containing protein/prepilin-type processing-associated H-X9-DG protein
MTCLLQPFRKQNRRSRFILKSSRAFTLVELLVVVAILGLLAALLTPAIQKALASGKTGKATGNLRQIGVLLNTYAPENNNCLPALIRWDNQDGTWWQRVVSESAGLTVKPWEPNMDRRLVEAFYDPALTKGAHPYGDFGGNQAIMKDYNPWVPGSEANAKGTSLGAIGPLSKKVIVASAEIPSGVPCKGSWFFQSEWVSQGNAVTDAKPSARHGGKALCLFADGHIEALDTENMSSADRRKYFLLPQDE